MNLENIMLSDISQAQKDKDMVPWIPISRINKLIKTEWWEIPRGWSEGWMGSYCLMDTQFMFEITKKKPLEISGSRYTALQIYLMLLNYILENYLHGKVNIT